MGLVICYGMTPEELVLQLKKKGTFDELRKQALQDFQANVSCQAEAHREIKYPANASHRNRDNHSSIKSTKFCNN